MQSFLLVQETEIECTPNLIITPIQAYLKSNLNLFQILIQIL